MPLSMLHIRRSPGYVISTVLAVGMTLGFACTMSLLIKDIVHHRPSFERPQELFDLNLSGGEVSSWMDFTDVRRSTKMIGLAAYEKFSAEFHGALRDQKVEAARVNAYLAGLPPAIYASRSNPATIMKLGH